MCLCDSDYRKGCIMHSHWNDYPTIQNKLQVVCSFLEKQLTVRNKDIQDALVEFSQAGGKYLRPAFFFLFAELGDPKKQNEEELIKVASSIELLHMATLIHDDIIDDSPLRRGTLTVQAHYGKDIAVYTGDLLFTLFFEVLIDVMNGSPFMATNAQAMKGLLLGELDQMNLRYNVDQTIDDYLLSVNGKTAELFWLACLEGAHFGKTSPQIEALAGEIGRNIGIAFQAYDDILDYTADEAILQKPVLEDLTQGVYTIPLLLAKTKNPAAFAPLLEKRANLTESEAKEVAALVVHYQGVEQAKAFARSYTEKALAGIQELPAGAAREQLERLTKQLLKRNH